MPNDGGEYESEYDDDEGSVGVGVDGCLVGGAGAATEVAANALVADGEEAVAVIADVHHPVRELAATRSATRIASTM